MSNFVKERWCKSCQKYTPHYFKDDTPRHHRYEVECSLCGEVPLSDVRYQMGWNVYDQDKEWAMKAKEV